VTDKSITDEEAFRKAVETTDAPLTADQVDEIVAVRRIGPSYADWKRASR